MLKRPIFAVVGLSVIALSLFLMFHKIEVTAPVGGLIAFGFLLVIFPHLPPLKFGLGKDGVTFETLAEKIVKLQQDTAGDRATLAAVQNWTEVITASTKTLAPASDREDVMPGTYGASPSANGRRLQASVTRLGSSELAKVRLKVSPEQGARPLSGTVTFHLHPTFAPQNHPTVPVNLYVVGVFVI